jgi:hypothetical protein
MHRWNYCADEMAIVDQLLRARRWLRDVGPGFQPAAGLKPGVFDLSRRAKSSAAG